MRSKILSLLALVNVLPVFGQNIDKMWNPAKINWVDTTKTEVIYVRSLTDKSLEENKKDLYILEIGRRNLHYRPYSAFLEDSVYKDLDTIHTTIKDVLQTYIPNRTKNIDVSSLWTDITQKEYKESGLALLNTVSYIEPVQKINWELIDTVKIYDGHKCKKAVADFRGRKWIAWYTEEIPVTYGPWKMAGLPGLILQAATDDKSVHLYAISLRSGGNPMGIKNVSEEILTRKSYLEFFNKFYKKGGKSEAIMKVAPPMPGQQIKKSPSREFFYVPMETDF